jgi:hypothetical protein
MEESVRIITRMTNMSIVAEYRLESMIYFWQVQIPSFTDMLFYLLRQPGDTLI